MNVYDLDLYFKELLSISDFDGIDVSQNGLQVACSKKPIKKIAFAVDACLENFQKAIQLGCDLLFVHHGIFWGRSLLITGNHYERISYLIKNDLALYAVHLPLDAHPLYGNNAGIARNLGLKDLESFGLYKGKYIGLKGRFTAKSTKADESFEDAVSLEELLSRLFNRGEEPRNVLAFGPKKIKTVGIISGAASGDVTQAISEGLDCFISGEIKHEVYHQALENKITVIAAGHYQSETFGVKSVMEKLQSESTIECFFLETPTGL